MLWFIICSVAAIMAVMIRSHYETHNFKIKDYCFKTDKVNENIKFGFITDLHNCRYGEKNKSIVEALSQEKCSFVIIGGDLICGKKNIGSKKPELYYGNAVDFLKEISGKMPVYYVFGNHETRVKNRKAANPLYNKYTEDIRDCRINILNNNTIVWKNKKDNLAITGVEIAENQYGGNEKITLQDCSGKSGQHGSYKILVAHTPEFFEEYSKADADLILCGHNHGGTVRLPWLGGMISRDYRLFPKYSYGIYKKNGKTMVLTSGLGDHTIHFRLFNMPEIVTVTLMPDNGKKVFEKVSKSDKM